MQDKRTTVKAYHPLTHPAIVCGGPQLMSVIKELEAGTYPQPEDAIWRGDLPRDLAVRLAEATGATDEQIAEVIREEDGPTWTRVEPGPCTCHAPPTGHSGWEIKNPLGDGRDKHITDYAIRTYGRKHVERLLADLPPLPEAAWKAARS
jgi:hypothetical protein